MQKINSFDYDLPGGLKTVEIWEGDILKWRKPAGLLIVSAFKGNYDPVPGSLIADLYEKGIDTRILAEDPELDMRDSLNTLLTETIEGFFFSRIMILEMISEGFFKNPVKSLENIFENLLISLNVCEKKGLNFKNLIMTIPGTGQQGLKLREVAELIPVFTEKLFRELKFTQSVIFVNRNRRKVDILSSKINERLRRPEFSLSTTGRTKAVRIGIRKRLMLLQENGNFNRQLLEESIELFGKEELKAWEVAHMGRRLLEMLLQNYSPNREETLYEKIMDLNGQVPSWLKSQMHMIRIFGNEMMHSNSEPAHFASPEGEDVLINMMCLERVLEWGGGK